MNVLVIFTNIKLRHSKRNGTHAIRLRSSINVDVLRYGVSTSSEEIMTKPKIDITTEAASKIFEKPPQQITPVESIKESVLFGLFFIVKDLKN